MKQSMAWDRACEFCGRRERIEQGTRAVITPESARWRTLIRSGAIQPNTAEYRSVVLKIYQLERKAEDSAGHKKW